MGDGSPLGRRAARRRARVRPILLIMRWALVAAGTALLCLHALGCSRKPVVLYNSGAHTVGGIATDATNVYWMALDQDGST